MIELAAMLLARLRERPAPLPAALAAVALLAAAPSGIERRGPAPPRDPRRIVTVAPSLTEILFAIGAGDRVVGVTRYDDFPPEVEKLPRVGGFVDPNPEAIVALRPDLVLAQPSPGNRGPLEAVGAAGVAVVAVPLHSLAELELSVREIGRLVGRVEQAEALAEKLRGERAAVRAQTARLPRRRVLLLHGRSPLVAAGKGSYTGALLEEAGAVNIAGDSRVPYPLLSAEWVLAQKPDVVILVPEAKSGESPPAGPVVPGLVARVVWLDANEVLRPGPRLGEGLRKLARAIHPELGQ